MFFTLLTWKCASRHNGVHFFDISTLQSGPTLVCFVHFDLEMCFAPQRRALFRHLNFQKWSDVGVFWSSLQLGWSGWGLGFCRYKVQKWGGGPPQNQNPGSDSHKLTMSNPSMLARVYVPKNNFWICRGRKVCPTETMRNYGDKQTTKRKKHQSRSKAFKRSHVDETCFANMPCTSCTQFYLSNVRQSSPIPVAVYWTEPSSSKSGHAIQGILQQTWQYHSMVC